VSGQRHAPTNVNTYFFGVENLLTFTDAFFGFLNLIRHGVPIPVAALSKA
jgi:hypothetical protein